MGNKASSSFLAAALLSNAAFAASPAFGIPEGPTPSQRSVSSDTQSGSISLSYSKTPLSVSVTITGLPPSTRLFTTKTTEGYSILAPVRGLGSVVQLPKSRILQIDDPSLTSVDVTSDGAKLRFRFQTPSTVPPQITRIGSDFIVNIPLQLSAFSKENISRASAASTLTPYTPPYSSISAPPVGRILSGILAIPNPAKLNISGPSIDLNIQNLNALTALEYVAKRGGYDIVFVKSDPTYVDPSTSLTTTTVSGTSPDELSNSQYPQTSGVSSAPAQSTESGEEGNSSLDNPRLITLSLRSRPFAQVFNTVLTASGLQAIYRDNIIYVGPDVLQKNIGDRISRTFRLNQVSAQSAAQYLGNLGASMTYTQTVTNSVTTGVSSQEAVASGSASAETTTTSSPQAYTYSSSTGPLLGLNGTTDSRLRQVTLIGEASLIQLASKFLERLDLRSRQVALSIKIYDVDLTNNDELSNQLSYSDGKVILTSDPSNSNVGAVLNPSDPRTGVPGVGTNPFTTTNTATPIIGTDGSTVVAPSNLYARGQDRIVYDTFRALNTSKSVKLLASPTLILMDEVDPTTSSGSSSGPTYNQASLFVGENVITGLEPVENTTACKQTLSPVGLELAATLKAVDDNGFVSFMIEPKLTAPDQTVTVPGCGSQTIVTTSERRYASGLSRIRDGQTLIMTGVISDRELTNNIKVPLLGDLPIFGSLFRSTSRDRKKKELVITVSPRILKDGDQDSYGYYQPQTSSVRRSMSN